jgi:hypothetical protein
MFLLSFNCFLASGRFVGVTFYCGLERATVFFTQAILALIGFAMSRRLCESNADDVCERTLAIRQIAAQVAPAEGLATAVKQSVFIEAPQ